MVLGATTAYAACSMPEDITIPDGATATEEEMLNGRATVQQFMADMEAYLECLEQETQVKAQVGEIPPEEAVLQVEQHNAAVAVMEEIAARFNEQLKIYKSVR